MAEDHGRSRLGRGLAALIGDSNAQMPVPDEGRERRRVAIGRLRPNPRNPRRHFDADDLEDLANSIREKGVIQPILVRQMQAAPELFEIIAGERRWRAAEVAHLQEVPILVIEASDREALELAIIENVQRTDLNAIEEARGYERLAQEFGYSQTDLARIIGKSRSHVANMIRLLKLPPPVEAMVAEGTLTAGHARALLGFADPEPVARRIVARGLNVRDVEKLAQREQHRVAAVPATEQVVAERPSEATALAERLAASLGLPVALETRRQGGEIRIRYGSMSELEALCRRLMP
jgi:ParB family chromosome partitioning protein